MNTTQKVNVPELDCPEETAPDHHARFDDTFEYLHADRDGDNLDNTANTVTKPNPAAYHVPTDGAQ